MNWKYNVGGKWNLLWQTSPTLACKDEHYRTIHPVRLSLFPHPSIKHHLSDSSLSALLHMKTIWSRKDSVSHTGLYCLLCLRLHHRADAHSSAVTFCSAGSCDCLQGSDPDNRLSILCLSPNVCQWAHTAPSKVRVNSFIQHTLTDSL